MNTSLNIKAVLFVLGMSMLAWSCDKDFEEVNTNPNDPENVPASLLLPTIIRSAASEQSGLAWNRGNVVMQLVARIQFTEADRYDWGRDGDPYGTFYDAMRDIKNLIEIATESGEDNYRGVALVMKAWMYSVMTDCYGQLPYTEATLAKEEVYLPAFDTQEVIYSGIISDLETANDLLEINGVSVSGDMLFNGSIGSWKKFANSLLLRIHMRLSDRIDPSSALQAIVDDPTTYPIIDSNGDNVALEYLDSYPNQQPLYTTRSGSFDEVRLSQYMEDALKGLNDTRLFAYAQPATNSGAGRVGDWEDYQGVPNGLSDQEALQYSPTGDEKAGGSNYVSRVGLLYSCAACDDDASPKAAQTMFMSYSEVQFLLAEARERNYISTGDAATYYRQGIEASFDYYVSRLEVGGYMEIADAVKWTDDSYLEQEAVAYTGSQDELLNKIGTQKWIALYFSGLEAWFDWRRTGIPTITPGPAVVQSTVPVRFRYPSDVQALNADNYADAIASQGEDNLNTRVWWDVD